MTEKIDIGWNFENSYAHLPESMFTRIKPTPVRKPELVILNEPLATTLGLNSTALHCKEGFRILQAMKSLKVLCPLLKRMLDINSDILPC